MDDFELTLSKIAVDFLPDQLFVKSGLHSFLFYVQISLLSHKLIELVILDLDVDSTKKESIAQLSHSF